MHSYRFTNGRRALLAGLAASGLGMTRAHAADAAGAVTTLRGDASAQGAAGQRSLAPSAAVFVGDLVVTGMASAIALRLGAATEVRLGAAARLRIDRFLVNAGGLLDLAQGAMLFDHDAKSPAPELAVRAPFGLIAVRGTRFFAGPSNNVFGVFVAEGTVTVIGVNRAVTLTAGQGTDIAKPGDEPTDPKLWGKSRIDQALASVI